MRSHPRHPPSSPDRPTFPLPRRPQLRCAYRSDAGEIDEVIWKSAAQTINNLADYHAVRQYIFYIMKFFKMYSANEQPHKLYAVQRLLLFLFACIGVVDETQFFYHELIWRC